MLSPKTKNVATIIRDRLKQGGVPTHYVSVTCHIDGDIEVIYIRIVKGMETKLPNGEMLFFYVAKLYDEVHSKYNSSRLLIKWVN